MNMQQEKTLKPKKSMTDLNARTVEPGPNASLINHYYKITFNGSD